MHGVESRSTEAVFITAAPLVVCTASNREADEQKKMLTQSVAKLEGVQVERAAGTPEQANIDAPRSGHHH